MDSPVITAMESIPRTVVLDLQHHDNCYGQPQRLLSSLTRQAKISELLESLGNADILEIRFGECRAADDSLPFNS